VATDGDGTGAVSAGLPRHNEIERIFGRRHVLVGMIHLLPLPGAPRYDAAGAMRAVLDRAVDEARQLEAAGFDGLMIENGGDVPFLPPAEIGPETIAALAVATAKVVSEVRIPVGVNCLANAADVSVAVAVASGGQFVRANQWVNAYVANEGLIEGRAGAVARLRRLLGGQEVGVWADVHVKLGSHAITADRSLEEQARDAAFFDADALIVTGHRLGDPPLVDAVRAVRDATSLAVVVGSGVAASNVADLLAVADAAIVGSSLKNGGVWWGELNESSLGDLVKARDAGALTART
jgi:membrane complex biogenesis BtpA family protein